MEAPSGRPARAVLLVAASLALLHGHACEARAAKAIQLQDSTFEAQISSPARPWFVLFYMPWCGYCKEVLPIWDSLAHDLDSEVNVAKVNLEASKLVEHRFRRKVAGYPTMLLLDGGKMFTYTGTRDILHLQQFARGGFRKVEGNAKADIPKDPAQMAILERLLEAAEDFVVGIQRGYKGIWANYKTEFVAAISVSFSAGAFFGFFVKAFIDWMLPPLPPAAAKKNQ